MWANQSAKAHCLPFVLQISLSMFLFVSMPDYLLYTDPFYVIAFDKGKFLCVNVLILGLYPLFKATVMGFVHGTIRFADLFSNSIF
jgi:hypothetical protein